MISNEEYNTKQRAENVTIIERKILGERLKIMRTLHNWKQWEVAEILDMPRPTYSGYEKGIREAGYQTLVKFSELYGCSMDYLFGKTDEPFAPNLEEFIEQPIKYKGYTLTPEETEEYIKILDLAVELKKAEEEKQRLIAEAAVEQYKKKGRRRKKKVDKEIQPSFDIEEEDKQLT